MNVEIALPDIDDRHLPPFVIARLAEPRLCPVLGPPLQGAVSRLAAGLHTVLLHRDPHGDIRSYGHPTLVAAVTGIDYDAQLWVDFEIPEPEGDLGDLRLAA